MVEPSGCTGIKPKSATHKNMGGGVTEAGEDSKYGFNQMTSDLKLPKDLHGVKKLSDWTHSFT